MKEKILKYVNDIDNKIQNINLIDDLDNLLKNHLIQIQFFQHERLIHLLVTLGFVFLCMTTIIVSITQINLLFAIISLILLVVLVFYILHYFLLENKVQYMYTQYDLILKEKYNRQIKNTDEKNEKLS